MKKQELLVKTRKLMVERVEFIDLLIYACGHKHIIDELKDVSSIFNRFEECIESQNRAKKSVVFIDMLNNNSFEFLKNSNFVESNRINELSECKKNIVKFIKTETLLFIEKMQSLLLNQIQRFGEPCEDPSKNIVINNVTIGCYDLSEQQTRFLQEFKDSILEIKSL